MMIRLQVEFTKYRHLGMHSGYSQIVQYLSRDRFHVVCHGAPDNDADLPLFLAPFRPWLRSMIAWGGMPWYRLSDLAAEMRVLPVCVTKGCDVIHFLDGEHSPQFLPRCFRRMPLATPRTVVTFHQPPDILRKLINCDILRWFDRVVLVSPSQWPFFAEYVPEDQLRVILHGVDDKFFHPGQGRKDGGKIRCITAGHWLRNWDVFEGVVRAFADSKMVEFNVVSSGRPELGGLPNVNLYNDLDDWSLADLYRSADVLFLPLTNATANNTLLEGMASGLAVLTSDLEATRAYVPNGAGILVENRVSAFVHGLNTLLSDVATLRRLGRSARARSEELAWPRIVDEFQGLYRQLMT